MNVFQKLKEKVDRMTPTMSPPVMDDCEFEKLTNKVGVSPSRAYLALGTLGGG